MNLERLKTNRLVFRSFTEDDYDDLFLILNNEEVCRYLPGDKVYNADQVKGHLNYFIKTFKIEEKNLHYVVELKDTEEMIGYCGCSYIKEFNTNEIEYFLKPKYYNNGYASEMAFKMKDVAIELGFPKLVGLADINNIPSQKILEKLGYQFVSIVDLWGSKLNYYELVL